MILDNEIFYAPIESLGCVEKQAQQKQCDVKDVPQQILDKLANVIVMLENRGKIAMNNYLAIHS